MYNYPNPMELAHLAFFFFFLRKRKGNRKFHVPLGGQTTKQLRSLMVALPKLKSQFSTVQLSIQIKRQD